MKLRDSLSVSLSFRASDIIFCIVQAGPFLCPKKPKIYLFLWTHNRLINSISSSSIDSIEGHEGIFKVLAHSSYSLYR